MSFGLLSGYMCSMWSLPIKTRSNSCPLQAWRKLHHAETLDYFWRINAFFSVHFQYWKRHNYSLSAVKHVNTSVDNRRAWCASFSVFPSRRFSSPSDRPAEQKWGGHGRSRLTPRADRCGHNTSLPDCKAVKLAAVQQTQHLHLSALTLWKAV